jgi:regulator of sirC expression with transglutaminase-like and TPR domain
MEPSGNRPGVGWDPAVVRVLDGFAEAVRGPDPEAVDLDEAAIRLAAVLQPRLDVVDVQSRLDELAAGCPSPTRDAIVRHLFATVGFDGDRSEYGHWRNSCIDQVMARRRGVPITLSVVVIEVARRLGVPLVGVGLPAHFVVGDPHDPDWFLDAFDGGRVLDRDGCRDLLERVTGGRIAWDDGLLRPAPRRAIVIRMLNNLQAAFERSPDATRRGLVAAMRDRVPELAHERAGLALRLAPFN